MNKKILIPIIGFFTLAPMALAFMPEPVNDVFRAVFSRVPPEYSSRGLFALIMFCLYFIGLSAVFKDAKLKNMRVVLGLLLGIISGIGIPYRLLETMYTTYGCVGGAFVVAAPVFFVIFLATRMKTEGDGKTFAHGFRAVAFFVGAAVVNAIIQAMHYDTCGFGGFSLFDVGEWVLIFFWIFAVINAFQAFGGGASSAVEDGRSFWDRIRGNGGGNSPPNTPPNITPPPPGQPHALVTAAATASSAGAIASRASVNLVRAYGRILAATQAPAHPLNPAALVNALRSCQQARSLCHNAAIAVRDAAQAMNNALGNPALVPDAEARAQQALGLAQQADTAANQADMESRGI